MPVDYFPSAIL
jgi:dynein heavy chain